jgi:hypothetical protein
MSFENHEFVVEVERGDEVLRERHARRSRRATYSRARARDGNRAARLLHLLFFMYTLRADKLYCRMFPLPTAYGRTAIIQQEARSE